MPLSVACMSSMALAAGAAPSLLILVGCWILEVFCPDMTQWNYGMEGTWPNTAGAGLQAVCFLCQVEQRLEGIVFRHGRWKL